jgi:glycosyltransferase involved in cell wall biosynthesis
MSFLITKCISSILKNEKKFIKEIIIINDSSNDVPIINGTMD